ncbi:MAG: energy transducer TonB [Candidatus Competibacterales bacterium]
MPRRLGRHCHLLTRVFKLQFVVDHRGQVLSYRIVESSGHRRLDEAVEGLLRRASPLPAMPTALGRDPLTVVVPIAFYLR